MVDTKQIGATMIDFKKTDKHLYRPGSTPELVDVPKMLFLAVDGTGDPNTSPAYTAAIEALYTISYAIKIGHKQTLEYVVPPLEGLWSHPDADITDKTRFTWTAMIRQPEFVTQGILDDAKASVARKKPRLSLAGLYLMPLTEGMCVQAMHIGPYDTEPETIAAMRAFAHAAGYVEDLTQTRCHHEIYLSDPSRTAPEKLKTVIRHPVKPDQPADRVPPA